MISNTVQAFYRGKGTTKYGGYTLADYTLAELVRKSLAKHQNQLRKNVPLQQFVNYGVSI
ncbi:hypothetical protein WG947_05900 [Pontibacter sp. H259]|uniref:hypothetical protein n=1 Tax=Pontibacter sp. H259 TaxID=3133421 RepID=UPI0030BA66BD